MIQKVSESTTNPNDSPNKLTIIIPFLNEGDEVENTLSSIRTTVRDKVDILIINDASTDDFDYFSVAKKYNANYIENKKRKGVAASRDYGVSMINTHYFLLLDGHMRFYQNDWLDEIINELDKDNRVLLCCDTKVLVKNELGVITEPGSLSVCGAKINLKGNMLNVTWREWNDESHTCVEEIPCVLGAGYAASKCYWQYLRGLEGLVYYGSDEAYISLKVWLEGGKCKLLKTIQIGHIYRQLAPYTIENVHSIFNKLLIAELLLPFSYKIRTFGALYEINPEETKKAFEEICKRKKVINELKEYYSKIFTKDFEIIVNLNKDCHNKYIDQQDNNFRKILLNCNSLPSMGLWYGRMGCIMFLALYDKTKNNNDNEELIGELIDDFYSNMRNDINVDFGYGLCGIAYGISWLLYNGLMDGDINDVLKSIDDRIMERNPLRITDYSLKTGLAGILYYVLYRLQIAQENNLPTPFDAEYLKQLYEASRYVIRDIEKSGSFEMASWFIAYTKDASIKLEIPSLTDIMNLSMLKVFSINSNNFSLNNGLVGLELSRLER